MKPMSARSALVVLLVLTTPLLAQEPDPAAIAGWIEALGSESFAERAAAEEALAGSGEAALEALRAVRDHPDPEVRGRVRRLLDDLESEIVIALPGPMSGAATAFGAQIRHGAELALADRPTWKGRPIVLAVHDDSGDPDEAVAIAGRLAADRSVSIVVGHFNSSCTIAARDVYERAGLVEFTPGSTNASVCAGHPTTFRNLYRDDDQGTLFARYAHHVLGLERIAVLCDNDDYGVGLADAFVAEAARIGLETLEPIRYLRERTQDFAALVRPLAGRGVDGVFIAGLYNEAALAAKALRGELEFEGPILAGDGVLTEAYIELAGEAAAGTYVATPFAPEVHAGEEALAAFARRYREVAGEDPTAWAVLAHDAVAMAAAGIRAVGPDRADVGRWMASRRSAESAFVGVAGPTWFDAHGDCASRGMDVVAVAGGRFVPAERQLPAELRTVR